MKKYFYIVVTLACLLPKSSPLFAQQIEFSTVLYSDSTNAKAYSVVQTTDNGYMMVGVGGQNNNGIIVKTDSVGAFVWEKEINDVNSLNYIISTRDSSYVIVGGATDSTGSNVAFCAKVDSGGNIKWTSVFGKLGEVVLAVQPTLDSGYIVTGYTQATYHSKIFVAKLDSSGKLQWEKSFSTAGLNGSGSSIVQTPDSGYAVTGSITMDSLGYTVKAFIIKLTPTGEIMWSKQYSNKTEFISGNDLLVAGKGFVFLLSGFGVVKTDSTGNILWVSLYDKSVAFQVGMPKLHKVRNDYYAYADGLGMQEIDSVGNLVFIDDLAFMPADLIETKDKGLLAIGNGPTFGDRLDGGLEFGDNPQIGLVKTDSLGNGGDCVFSNANGPNSDTLTASTLVLTSSTASLTIPHFHYVINPAQLLWGNGCVTFISGISNTGTKDGIAVFPNPAFDDVNIVLPPQCFFAIYNIFGQVMQSGSTKITNQNTMRFSLADYPDGIYFIRAQLATGVQTIEFVVQK